jgi:hypothetical protein
MNAVTTLAQDAATYAARKGLPVTKELVAARFNEAKFAHQDRPIREAYVEIVARNPLGRSAALRSVLAQAKRPSTVSAKAV